MAKYFFRVDGGNIYSIATGHIKRCLKLADYISSIEKEDADICFIMKNYKDGVRLADKKYKVITFSANSDLKNEIEFLRDIISREGYFICDIRGIDNRYIAEIKKICFKFVLFDDLCIKDVEPDIIINPTPFSYQEYNEADYSRVTLLLGEKFFFVDPGLIKRTYTRDFNKESYKILVSFGGADPLNITEFFIKNFVTRLKQHNISIVLGPAYSLREEIVSKYSHIKNIKLYLNLNSLDTLLLDSDIAFVAGGDTCIEACASGLATFIISSIAYERKLAQALHARNIAYFLADKEKISDDECVDDYFLESLRKNKELLGNLSKNTRSLIDGYGLERVYNIIKENNHEHQRSGIYTN